MDVCSRNKIVVRLKDMSLGNDDCYQEHIIDLDMVNQVLFDEDKNGNQLFHIFYKNSNNPVIINCGIENGKEFKRLKNIFMTNLVSMNED